MSAHGRNSPTQPPSISDEMQLCDGVGLNKQHCSSTTALVEYAKQMMMGQQRRNDYCQRERKLLYVNRRYGCWSPFSYRLSQIARHV